MTVAGEKIKVLVLTSTYPRWQGDTVPAFVAELSERLAIDHEVHVLAPHFPGSKRHEIMNGVHVTRFMYSIPVFEKLAYGGGVLENIKAQPALYLVAPFYFIAQFISLCHIHYRHRFSLLHAHWIIPQGVTVSLFKSLFYKRTPLLVTSHGGDLFALNHGLLERIKQWVMSTADHITVVSSAMKARCIESGVSADKVSVKPMGVDLQNRFFPRCDSASRKGIVFVGRLVEKKGVTFLLDAFSTLADEFENLTLTIVGDGPLRSNLEKQCSDLGIDGAVEFTGNVVNTDIPDLLSRARIAVIPSVVAESGDQEGLGLVIAEAMGCECAVVASDLPAIKDLLLDGKTGVLFTAGDAEELAMCVLQLLKDDDACLALAKAGRQFVVDNYDWSRTSLGYQELINKLVSISGRLKSSDKIL